MDAATLEKMKLAMEQLNKKRIAADFQKKFRLRHTMIMRPILNGWQKKASGTS